jgi:hypothetical protein
VNQRILNYKKGVERKGQPDWSYKEAAIKEVANLFRISILQTAGFPKRAEHALLVPVPPHKTKSDPGYDDRQKGGALPIVDTIQALSKKLVTEAQV